MTGKRRRFGSEFKAKIALMALKGEQSANEIASHYQVHPNQVNQWKRQLLTHAPELFQDGRGSGGEEEELRNRLYQEIGQLKVELDFLKKKFGSPG